MTVPEAVDLVASQGKLSDYGFASNRLFNHYRYRQGFPTLIALYAFESRGYWGEMEKLVANSSGAYAAMAGKICMLPTERAKELVNDLLSRVCEKDALYALGFGTW